MSDRRRRVLRSLEQVFFGGMELAALSSPAFAALLVLQERYPDAVPVAGLLAIVTGSVGLAVLRSGAVDTGAWPRRSELSSMPLRVGYFSALFLASSLGVAAVAVEFDVFWMTAAGGLVQPLGLAAFPIVYRVVHGEPLRKPGKRP